MADRPPPTELKLDISTSRAYVRYQGRKKYFGKWGTMQATQDFADWLKSLVKKPDLVAPSPDITVMECVRHFLFYAEGYYSRDGMPTQEFRNLSAAMDSLLTYAGGERDLAREFGPLKLLNIQTKLGEERLIKRNGEPGRLRHSRGTINAKISRIRRCFTWCASRELVPAAGAAALQTVASVRKGRTACLEHPPVEPVDLDTVRKTLPFMSPTVSAMVRVQYLCGMRPQDVCRILPSQIDQSRDVWIFEPPDHKTAYLGDQLVKAIPRMAQEILKQFMPSGADEPFFSPADTMEYWRSRVRQRPRRGRPKKLVRRCYTTASYGKAIKYAIARAAASQPPVTIELWSPNQLRHAIGTDIREAIGIEAAQLYLGHSDPDTSLIYAKQSVKNLIEIARSFSSPELRDDRPLRD